MEVENLASRVGEKGGRLAGRRGTPAGIQQLALPPDPSEDEIDGFGELGI